MAHKTVSVNAVADYFLLLVEMHGELISNLKLQKLVYYAQAWSLALNNRPLFDEEIQAWARGPVCPPLYRRFKKYRWNAIDTSVRRTNPLKEISETDRELLDDIWEEYAKFSSTQLVYLTHEETPWKKTYGQRPYGSKCEDIITHKAMKKYYKAELERA